MRNTKGLLNRSDSLPTRSWNSGPLAKENEGNGKDNDRMDRQDMEPDSRLHGGEPRLRELLRAT
jgi:hypothetical protein